MELLFMLRVGPVGPVGPMAISGAPLWFATLAV